MHHNAIRLCRDVSINALVRFILETELQVDCCQTPFGFGFVLLIFFQAL